MLSSTQIDAAGSDLFMQHERREEFRRISAAITIEDAQHIQDAYVRRLLAKFNADVGGFKVALTTKQIRDWLNIYEPACGQIISNRIHESPHIIKAADYVRLSIEPEICVVLKSDMAGCYTIDEVRENIRSLHCAYELVEDRGANLGNLDVVSLTADNCWNAGVVIGPAADPSLDLAKRLGRLWVNDRLVTIGTTEECLNGNPLHVVSWLAEYLGKRGRSIKEGQPVMTGSIVKTQFLEPGDQTVFQMDDMPSVKLAII